MQKTLTILAACLAACMIFASCGTVASTTEAVTSASESEAEIGDISGEFRFVVAGNQEWNDFSADENSEALVDIAIYERNKKIENEYGVSVLTDEFIGFRF